MKSHVNIPIFIPHLGCPNTCVFCNQRTISGVQCFDISTVKEEIELALSTLKENQEAEIAFFGGSFTGIGEELMTELLKIGYFFVKAGKVSSLRCSTRPDYINSTVLDVLEKYGMKTIELGLQSSSDAVLSASKRGHTLTDEARAVKMIRERGFSLVGQMMIGLPKSTLEDELETARFIIDSGASAVRIYPTVVFFGTELHNMCLKGDYTPISLSDAVERCARVMELFINAGVDVIRIGLCESENMHSKSTYFAGPNHSALGELVIGEVYYNLILKALSKLGAKSASEIEISIPKNSLSKVKGQKKNNYLRLVKAYPACKFIFKERDLLSEYKILVKVTKGEIKCT